MGNQFIIRVEQWFGIAFKPDAIGVELLKIINRFTDTFAVNRSNDQNTTTSNRRFAASSKSFAKPERSRLPFLPDSASRYTL